MRWLILLFYSSLFSLSLEQISQYLPPNPIVVEAGAHTGSDTLRMSRFWPQGMIYAFEPNLAVYPLLKQVADSACNVVSYPIALGNAVGMAPFYLSKELKQGPSPCNAQSSLFPPSEEYWRWDWIGFESTPIQVPITTLDLWAEEHSIDHIDFLWLDMQGSEFQMLQASPQILKTVKVIQTEFSEVPYYVGTLVFKDLKSWLEKRGFRLIYKDPESHGDAVFVYRGLPDVIALYGAGEEVSLPISLGSSFDPLESDRFLKRLISPGDLVFDVGAHIGKNTALYLACGAKVVSIEPQPKCIEALKEKFSGNPQVFIEPVALGAKEAVSEMYISSESPTISTLSLDYTIHSRFADRGCRWDEKMRVPVSTIDRLIDRYGVPDYCKIDVENFEFEVLSGLHHPIPLISFECNADSLLPLEKCLKLLVEKGYSEFNFAFGERGYFLFPDWLDSDTLIKEVKETISTHDFSSIWGLWGDVYARFSDVR